jgi:hypothetical protein
LHIQQSDIERIYPVRLPTETRAQRLARMAAKARPDPGFGLPRYCMDVIRIEPGTEPTKAIASPAVAPGPGGELPIGIEWDRSNNRPLSHLNRADIIKIVGVYFGLSRHELCGQRRTAPFVRARQVAYYSIKQALNCSFPHIDRAFDGRDHTTVMYGIRRVQERIDAGDAKLAADIAAINALIAGAPVPPGSGYQLERTPPRKRTRISSYSLLPARPKLTTIWTTHAVARLRELEVKFANEKDRNNCITAALNDEWQDREFSHSAVSSMRGRLRALDRRMELAA